MMCEDDKFIYFVKKVLEKQSDPKEYLTISEKIKVNIRIQMVV